MADAAAVASAVRAARPDVVINAAAYNRVDNAETEPATALAVNATGVLRLARAATGSFERDQVLHEARAERARDQDDGRACAPARQHARHMGRMHWLGFNTGVVGSQRQSVL